MSDRLITDRADLAKLITASGGGPHYVYLLRVPDGEPSFGGLGTPFYVGIGQGSRLFAHEEEARDPARSGAKVEMIRSIWAKGGEVVRTIDSVHTIEPWDREEELINSIGRLRDMIEAAGEDAFFRLPPLLPSDHILMLYRSTDRLRRPGASM